MSLSYIIQHFFLFPLSSLVFIHTLSRSLSLSQVVFVLSLLSGHPLPPHTSLSTLLPLTCQSCSVDPVCCCCQIGERCVCRVLQAVSVAVPN